MSPLHTASLARPTTIEGLFDRWQERAPWFDLARCRDYDTEIFFPEKGESPRRAKRICSACPVRLECLNYAMRENVPYGVWGGMSDRERRRLRRIAS